MCLLLNILNVKKDLCLGGHAARLLDKQKTEAFCYWISEMQFHVQKQTFSVPLASCNDFDSWFHLATSNYVQRRTLQMLWCVFQLLHWIWHLPLKLFHILHELSRKDILFPWTQIMFYHNHSHRPLWKSNFIMIYLFFVVAYPWNNNSFPEV